MPAFEPFERQLSKRQGSDLTRAAGHSARLPRHIDESSRSFFTIDAKQWHSGRYSAGQMRKAVTSTVTILGLLCCTLADKPDSMKQLIAKDYDRLTGKFRLIRGVIDGKEVPEEKRRQTILMTDHNSFSVSDKGVAGTSAAGTFTINPTKTPKTVDSLQAAGPDKGKNIDRRVPKAPCSRNETLACR